MCFFKITMAYLSAKNRKLVLLLSVVILAVFPLSITAEEQPLNQQTTAVHYVFTQSVERALYPWLKEEVANLFKRD